MITSIRVCAPRFAIKGVTKHHKVTLVTKRLGGHLTDTVTPHHNNNRTQHTHTTSCVCALLLPCSTTAHTRATARQDTCACTRWNCHKFPRASCTRLSGSVLLPNPTLLTQLHLQSRLLSFLSLFLGLYLDILSTARTRLGKYSATISTEVPNCAARML